MNIFNINKKIPLIKKLDSPIRINLSKNSNNNNNSDKDNNLNTIDYSTIDDIKYVRKISGKSMKRKMFIHQIKVVTYIKMIHYLWNLFLLKEF